MSKRINIILRARLKQEAIANTERDAAIAGEWLPLEEEIFKIARPANSSSSKPAPRVDKEMAISDGG